MNSNFYNELLNIIDKEKSYPLIELEFEGIQLKFPKDLHDMLTFTYGDYMKLPPENERTQYMDRFTGLFAHLLGLSPGLFISSPAWLPRRG